MKIMSSENFIKNITSKDINLSTNTIKNLIDTENIEQFKELCDKADFIFPFLKERITADFVKLICKENLKTIFEFSKIYSYDFEDLIINSWLKFADENLTDEILELFEKGTNEQKAYCAKYFYYIQDSIALEYLNKYALFEFEPLKNNCATTLAKFGDVKILNEMKNIILTSDDEFKKLNAYSFICAYNGEEQIKFILKNAFSSPFLASIISKILDFNDINYLKSFVDNYTLSKILNVIIEEYPEEIELNTIFYWNIFEYIKTVKSFKNQYSNNILLIAKKKFKEFSQNDIYTFDLDKNLKSEIKNISNYLNSIELSIENPEEELTSNDNYRILCALNVIKEYKLNKYSSFIANLFNNNKLNYEQMANSASVLKELNEINLINKDAVQKIQNENIRILIESYF